jgi:hypothetical protein
MMKKLVVLLLVFCFGFSCAGPWDDHGYLEVSDNQHYLEYEDGTEFFFMGDTVWHINSLDRNEVVHYLDNRKSKGFNVVMFPADNFDLSSFGENNPNRMHNYDGKYPLVGSAPYSSVVLNEDYWSHVDYIVEEARKRDMYVLMLSTWGFGLNTATWDDPYNRLYEYGRAFGDRYKDKKNVIFGVAGEFCTIMGSYTPLTDSTRVGWLDRLGQGIDSTANPKQLVTIHGNPGAMGDHFIPSEFFKDASWIDFYGNQNWQNPKYIDDMLYGDWQLTNPTRPTINLEPGYEDGYSQWAECNTASSPWGQRYMAYLSVFYGGFGHAYGHDRLAAMSGPGFTDSGSWSNRNSGILDQAALDDTGGSQMVHLKNLMTSKPINSRIPDPYLIKSGAGTDEGHTPDRRVATRDENNTWAFVYLTQGGGVTVDLSGFEEGANASWYNPRDGEYTYIGNFTGGDVSFDAPSSGVDNDWVLVLESHLDEEVCDVEFSDISAGLEDWKTNGDTAALLNLVNSWMEC